MHHLNYRCLNKLHMKKIINPPSQHMLHLKILACNCSDHICGKTFLLFFLPWDMNNVLPKLV